MVRRRRWRCSCGLCCVSPGPGVTVEVGEGDETGSAVEVLLAGSAVFVEEAGDDFAVGEFDAVGDSGGWFAGAVRELDFDPVLVIGRGDAFAG